MQHPRSVLLTLPIFALILVSCGSAWNRLNAGGLERDLETLLTQAEIEVDLQGCNMIGTTRSGYCRFQDSDGDATTIIQAFHLHQVVLENATVPFIDAEFEAGCGSFPWILDGSGGAIHIISGRPDVLMLSTETSFEYLLLVYEPSSGEACLQVSYAYG